MFRVEGSGAGLMPDVARRRSKRRASLGQWHLKRVFDLTTSLLLLLLLLPLLVVVAVGVAFSSGYPVIYSHERVGLRGRHFRVYKFRSMRRNADQALSEFLDSCPAAREEWHAFQKLRDDPRVTPFGRFLRSSSLDELPQLWNVVKGDMSLVGPRPVTAAERRKYGPQWRAYCSMRPGISGLWQVNGRNRLTYSERVAYDVAYVANWSLRLDFTILLKTLFVVVRGEGSM